MVRLAVELEDFGLEVLTIGGHEDPATVMEVAGGWLRFVIALRNDGSLRFLCSSMDEPETEMHNIVTTGDTTEGWSLLRRLIGAMETEGIRSVKQRPIELGGGCGRNAFVIA